jgi:hypothetical protein
MEAGINASREFRVNLKMSANQPFMPVMTPPSMVTTKAGSSQIQPKSTVWCLAAAMIAAALFSTVPAVAGVLEYLQYRDAPDAPFVGRWALAILLVAMVQASYGVLLIQVSDWSAVWVATLSLLAVAAMYAMALGLVLVASPSGWLVGPEGLQLADKLTGGKAALWCLCMVSMLTILAFFAGRLCLQWQRAEAVLRRAGA